MAQVHMVVKDHLHIKISEETKKKLQELAIKDKRKLSDYCRLILEAAVEEKEQE